MLYLGQEYVGVSLDSDLDHPKLYYIMTDKGESQDKYNLTRAKDNGIRTFMEDMQKGGVHRGLRRYLDALKVPQGTHIA